MKKRFGLKLLLLWCFVPLTSSATANIRLPSIVGDNIILQRRMGVPIWGCANAVTKHDTVVVSAKGVPIPVALRYAWAMNPSRRNLLYNKEGIPASPFRTDDWPLFNAVNYVPTEQVKPGKNADYEPIPLTRPLMTQ